MQVKREGAQNKQNVQSWSDNSDSGMKVLGRKGQGGGQLSLAGYSHYPDSHPPPHLLARISSMWAGTLKEVS